MNFSKAIDIVNKNKNLVGKEYNGVVIDEIIVYPTNTESCNNFLNEYMRSQNAQTSIAPYMREDVDVAAIFDKKKINCDGVFFHSSLQKLQNSFDITF
jgi:hypothetical protein